MRQEPAGSSDGQRTPRIHPHRAPPPDRHAAHPPVRSLLADTETPDRHERRTVTPKQECASLESAILPVVVWLVCRMGAAAYSELFSAVQARGLRCGVCLRALFADSLPLPSTSMSRIALDATITAVMRPEGSP